jgi:DNA-binding CsgD family transcriptional regulator
VRRCTIGLAIALAEAGNPADAQQQCVRALGLAREARDLRDQADCLELMARLALQEGRLSEASAHLHEGAEIAVRMGQDFMLIDYLDLCGHLCARTQRHADALTTWAAHAAQLKTSDLLDLPTEHIQRQTPLQAARQMLGPGQARAAEERGAAMELATAAEYLLLLTSPQQPADPPGLPGLSARERQLVILVAQGRTDAQIAGQLYLSIRTVRTHLDRVRDKTGCRRRADLTRLALQAGFL